MGRNLRNTVSVLLAVIILITSNGIVLASHTCLKKSTTTVSLFQSKSCCGKAKMNSCDSRKTDSVKRNCCLNSTSYHKTTVSTLPAVKSLVQSALPVTSLLRVPVNFTTAIIGLVSSIKPPPLITEGRDLLKLFSIFLI
jgi:hypothetical protein